MNQGTSSCSSCGTALPPFVESDGKVRCGACGTVNAIAMPPTFGVPAGGYGAYNAPPAYVVPGARTGCGVAGVVVGLVVAVFVLLFVGGFLAFFLARSPSSAPAPAPVVVGGGGTVATAAPAPVAASLMTWEGVHGPILVDVNGDGTPDVVGRVRYVAGGDHVALAAFDGPTGRRLWESAPVGTYGETYQGDVVLADDLLLFTRPGVDTTAWRLHDGTKRWTVILPEKVRHVCRGDHAGEVRALLADDSAQVVRLADGRPTSSSKVAKTAPCARLPSDAHDQEDPGVDVRRFAADDAKVPGMQVRVVVQRVGGPKVVVGIRTPGTSVPMIAARYPDAPRNWKSDLPGARALETSLDSMPPVAVTAGRAFTEYGFTSGGATPHEVVGFDLGGHRLWEAPLGDWRNITAIAADDHRVYVSQSSRLTVLDAATGRSVYVVGSR